MILVKIEDYYFNPESVKLIHPFTSKDKKSWVKVHLGGLTIITLKTTPIEVVVKSLTKRNIKRIEANRR